MENTTLNTRFSDKFLITNLHTWQFILLNIGSLGAWHQVWMYTLCESLNKQEKRIAIHLSIPIIAMVACTLSTIFYYANLTSNESSVIEFLLFLICISLQLCISFISKPVLEKMLAENGTPRRLNSFLCFIFPVFYQYYIIRKAEEYFTNEEAIRAATAAQNAPRENKDIDKLMQIEKLAALKNSGVISEDEFSIEKKKILSGEE